ncbi:hypothetical protein A4G16_01370 [Mannheimia granulomatis]|uniref:Uncharacterized protein n=1 Tax=Mannheimia granulomatis TaxID=85402 RepID=A0A6G8JG76_9PAST|nr:hypothetical protein [Mannheimia granulomatis]QIM66121.1 hypothetical protein A4G16_01370 [Mannheimia granulomatis]
MKKIDIQKNIIELIFALYITIATFLYFYIENLPQKDFLMIQDIANNYNLTKGLQTRLTIEYSKILNTLLSTLTLFFIISLFRFRNSRKHPRNRHVISHYVFVFLFIPISFYFLWISEWDLFSSNHISPIKEISAYIFVTCSLHAWFISEFWYFIDILEKTYRKIKNKKDNKEHINPT